MPVQLTDLILLQRGTVLHKATVSQLPTGGGGGSPPTNIDGGNAFSLPIAGLVIDGGGATS
jgi:hypothetical protein